MVAVSRRTVVEAPIEQVWHLLRDFNSHESWHPAIAHSEIESRRRNDEVVCVRHFRLQNGGELRQQLLTLSDRDHCFTYCILDAPIPLIDYVRCQRAPQAHHQPGPHLLGMVLQLQGSRRARTASFAPW